MTDLSAAVIAPLGENRTTITEAMLIATSVPEAPPALYNNATTYALDATVSRVASANGFDVYQSLQGGNLNHTPESSPTFWQLLGRTYGVYDNGHNYFTGDGVIDDVNHLEYTALANSTGAGLADTSKFVLVGPTNRWRAFDLNSSTGTTAASPMSFTIAPGQRVDAVGLAGLVADSFTITVFQSTEEVYQYTESLSTRVVRSWRDWLTKPFTFRSESARFDLPLISNATVIITFTRASGDVTVGALFANRHVNIGVMEEDPDDDADNFSTFTRNIEGSATSFVEKRVIPILSARTSAPAERVPEIRTLRNALRSTPAFWAGLKDPTNPYFGSVQRVGVWRRFKVTPGHPEARIELDVEEA